MFINTLTKKITKYLGLVALSLTIAFPIYSQELSHQQLDSLYTKFLQIRAPELLPQSSQLIPLTPEDEKCGYGIVNQIRSNFQNFDLEQQNILKPFLQRPQLSNYIISPNQHFRIHYTNSGADAIGYDINLLAQAVDSTYSFEIGYLGYPSPPADGSEGGDEKYDIYVLNLGNLYGQTTPETNVGVSSWTSYIEMDNDFPWYSNANPPKQPIDAARVTVAHEFHHSIQFGSYAPLDGNSYRASDRYFYELTSTSMEEFVYNSVNDYYAYMDTYFNSTFNTFPDHSGYDLAVWNIYLVKFYNDFGIIKRQWELMPTQRAMIAIGISLSDKGSSFAHDYNRFGIWTFFTNTRSVQGKYFEEAANYPLVKNQSEISFSQNTFIEVNAKATSNNFVKFGNTTNGDSLYAIITNGDINAVLINPTQIFPSTYTLYSDPETGTRNLGDSYSANFQVSNAYYWSVSEILNGVVIREDSTVIPVNPTNGSFAFPNPFRYNGNLSISFETKLGEDINFNVYSSDMSLVYSESKPASSLLNNTVGVDWDGKDDGGDKLASGVYIYVIKQGDQVIKGKVVIFNE